MEKIPHTSYVSKLLHLTFGEFEYVSIDLCSKNLTQLLFWPFYDHSWSFFHKVHSYLSQNWGQTDSHFEVLTKFESELDQELRHKSQILLTTVFFNFGRKKTKNFRSKNGHFFNICGHFLATTRISFTKLRFRRSFWGA